MDDQDLDDFMNDDNPSNLVQPDFKIPELNDVKAFEKSSHGLSE